MLHVGQYFTAFCRFELLWAMLVPVDAIGL